MLGLNFYLQNYVSKLPATILISFQSYFSQLINEIKAEHTINVWEVVKTRHPPRCVHSYEALSIFIVKKKPS